MSKERRRQGPENYLIYLETWQRAWIEAWAEEFFCDLFGLYTLGPAYAWAHLHLCAKRGGNSFRVPLLTPNSHPADDARMRVLLHGLRIIGFEDEADLISRRWAELNRISGFAAEPEYNRCFPDGVLKVVAEKAHGGVKDMRCRVAAPTTVDTVHCVLNQAWTQFWNDPQQYTAWEATAVKALTKVCG